MYFRQNDWRNNHHGMYDNEDIMGKRYFNTNSKGEMDNLLNSLLQNPMPLKKNLADSIITPEEKPKKKAMLNVDMGPPKVNKNTNNASLPNIPAMAGHMSYFGIPNIVCNLFNAVKGAVAHWRPKSPDYDYYDERSHQMPPPTWQSSNGEVQNKSAHDSHSNSKSDMNISCRLAAEQCEKKFGQLSLLLASKPTETGKFQRRRPKRQFVEPDLVEDKFEDALSPEDVATLKLANDAHFGCQTVYQTHEGELFETASPKIKIETKHLEDMDIIKSVPLQEERHIESVNSDNNIETVANTDINVENCGEILVQGEKLVSNNENKCPKLTKVIEIPLSNQDTGLKSSFRRRQPSLHIVCSTTKDKHYKNPNRTTDKRKKCKQRMSIQDDLVFANEIAAEDMSSVENSPSIRHLDRLYKKHVTNAASSPVDIKDTRVDSFDEISGRFNSTSSTNSDDAFQIVFNDSPKESRLRQFSDCDSEDSFIVFDNSPDGCYTSNDVFGDSDESDSDYTESESELSDTEDVPVQKLSHNLTRTCCDLTNCNLYVDKPVDVVDCSVRTVNEAMPELDISDVQKTVSEVESSGVLLNDSKKLIRRNQPPKKVQFSSNPPKVHVMRVWAFAARQARAGHWERCVIDRERFKRRIADVDLAVSWVLKPQHRSRVMFQRFMPWWNAQKRKELAEKKAKEEEEKARLEMAKNSVNGNVGSVDENNGNTVDGNNDIVNLNHENVNNGNDSLVQSDVAKIVNGNSNIAKLNGINVDRNSDIVNGNNGKQNLNDNNGKDLDIVNKLNVLKINGVNDLNKSILNSTLSMPVQDKFIDLQPQDTSGT